MASIGKLSWRKVIHYFLGQYIGAFLAAVIVYVVYREAIIETFGSEFQTTGVNGTAGIFGTFANEKISTGTAILDQV
jgi:glycerol uptake facilitator-like aquaporin